LKKQVIIEEVELVQRCIQGERKASFVLYHRYARQMLNVAYRILRNEEEAKDVLQEAFIKAFKQIGSLKNQAGFGGWLKRIVVNTAINHGKKQGVQFVDFSEAKNEHLISSEEPEGEEMIGFNLQLAKSALLELPNGYRTVLSLYLIEGYDHEEIAGILGISKSTSLSQYHRSKKKLISIIKKKLNNHE